MCSAATSPNQERSVRISTIAPSHCRGNDTADYRPDSLAGLGVGQRSFTLPPSTDDDCDGGCDGFFCWMFEGNEDRGDALLLCCLSCDEIYGESMLIVKGDCDEGHRCA
jgi:hypothetical protein